MKKSAVPNFKFSYSKEDLEMKKLLLNLLVLMSKDSAAVQVSHRISGGQCLSTSSPDATRSLCLLLLQLYKEEQVMSSLLTLAKPPSAPSERRPASPCWSRVQREELQLQALATLATVAPLMLDEYMSCQGNACLLLLLDWCTGKGQ